VIFTGRAIMSEFILGNSVRKLARKYPLLQQSLLRLDFAMVWLVAKLARLLPIDAASRFGERVGRWIGPKLTEKSAKFRHNMATAFPELDDAELDDLVARAWGRAGRVMAEYPHLDALLNDPERIIIDIREPVATYTDPTKPCVMVSAHVSNWEVVCLAMARMGIPNASLYSPPTNTLLDKMLLDSRRALGCELLPRDNSARGLMRALKSGRTAAMVMDRRIDEGKPIEFFGRKKPSTILAAKLALKQGCAFVPVQVERLKDARYRVIFHPPIRPSDTTVDETAQAIDMVQQVHHQFEAWIRQCPQEWFCPKLIWPKTFKRNQLKATDHETAVDSRAA
jgi:Kdo2-lipid IVA lauroyltransferase/acyltransferase